MVESQPSKLLVAGSIPVSRSICSEGSAAKPLRPRSRSTRVFGCFLRFEADVAQLVEHSLGKGEVTSSILVIGSRDLWKSEERRGSKGGSNSVVESQPSKLLVAGSIPVSRSRV